MTEADMTNVFIGGSRRISRLNSDIRSRIDQVSERGFRLLVGDANGADKSVQRYLYEKRLTNVEVYCSGGECRNNIGAWPIKAVIASKRTKDLDFYSAKDQAMADAASCGIMLWDGNSLGTLLNAARLLDQGKPVEIYVGPEKSFLTFHTRYDFDRLVEEYVPALQEKLDRQIKKEDRRRRVNSQPSLF